MGKLKNDYLTRVEKGEIEMIPKRDVYLYVDVICCGCGKLVALSNTQQIGYHRYCNRCSGGNNVGM